MTPTPQAIENAARAIYTTWAHNRRVEETWDEIVHLGHSIVDEARQEAKAALSCDLGDMVLVPKQPTEAMLVAAIDLDEIVRGALYPAHPGSVYRAMIAAAEDVPCK